jgi:hypothetical protein
MRQCRPQQHWTEGLLLPVTRTLGKAVIAGIVLSFWDSDGNIIEDEGCRHLAKANFPLLHTLSLGMDQLMQTEIGLGPRDAGISPRHTGPSWLPFTSVALPAPRVQRQPRAGVPIPRQGPLAAEDRYLAE